MNLKIYLSGLLREMQISPKYLGYLYLEAIVLYAFENRLYLKSLSRFVYPEIAKKFETATKSVEKAVDNVISITYEKGGLSAFCPNNCPSNKEVISFFVNKLTEYSYKWGNLSQTSYR
jgi:two-component system response regulator (stage 0 sporulation protein A)